MPTRAKPFVSAKTPGFLIWLKEHMLHIMVLANGLFLTVTAFWTIQLFIDQMLKEDYKQLGLNAKQIISDRLEDFSAALEETSGYIMSQTSAGLPIDPLLKNPLLKNRFYDMFVWIPADNPGAAVKLISGKEKIDFNPADALAIAKAAGGSEKFIFLSDKIRSRAQNGATVVQARQFALVTAVRNGQGARIGYLAGYSSLGKIITFEQITSDRFVSKTQIWDGKAHAMLFLVYNVDKKSLSLGQQFQYDFSLPLADTEFFGRIIFKKGSKNNLLEVLPFLISGFGLIVTVIALSYVTSNHKKSKRLHKGNLDLALKNRELNDEMREREKLFQTLRKSERENTAIINAISDILFEISPAGEILFLNEAWTRITGFDLQTSLGLNLFEMLPAADRGEQREHIALLTKGQKTAYRTSTRLRTVHGNFRSVELSVSMLRQDESRNLRVLGSFTDIEERQRAEQALIEAEKKYKTIWENAAGGIYQLSREGRFISVNPSLAKIFGFEMPDDMIAKVQNAHDHLFVDPHTRLQYLKAAILHPGEAMFHECQAKRLNGETIWIRENFRAVVDESGNFKYFEGSIEDISQQKSSEVQLREAKIQSDMASRAKSEFLANISHELRTPLNSIIGFSEIIRNEVFGPIEPKSYTEYAGNIYESGRHLLSIINQILDISRIDAGERELNESLIDVRKIATVCLDLSRGKINQAGLTVIDIIPENLPKLVAEEIAVKQMLLNLISNATKFTYHGGRITMNAEIDANGRFRISVTDTGVGLSAEQIEKSMQPFGLVDGRLDKGTGGAGLGLSLVHSLLRLHGGELEILSQKGIGTTASLIFPASRVQA